MIKDTRAFINECAKNARKRRQTKKYQDEWRKSYSSALRAGISEHKASPESMVGSTAKKSIFNLEWKKPENEDMVDREKSAIEEAKKKAKCVAPAFSKGAYQYIGSEAAAIDAGKKNSQIE